MKHPLPVAVAGLSVAMCLAAALAGVMGMSTVHHPRRRVTVRAASAPAPEAPVAHPMIGVAGQPVAAWEKLTGLRTSLSVTYISMASPVASTYVRWAEVEADGARPLIEIMPDGWTLQAIASGQADSWLRALKAQINEPVALAFAPEANGDSYAWAGQPASFRQAWRRVWSVIGTADVTWVWQMSTNRHPLAPYWPGARYVGWAGIDGYFEQPSMTFRNLFGQTIRQVRRVAPSMPVVLTETAAGPLTGHVPEDISRLFAGARSDGLAGVVWFDRKQDDPPYHQDWLLTGNAGALAAYRQAATAYVRSDIK